VSLVIRVHLREFPVVANAFSQTCKSIRILLLTRPVYHHIAPASSDDVAHCLCPVFSVFMICPSNSYPLQFSRAEALEHGWLTRGPRPAISPSWLPTVYDTSEARRRMSRSLDGVIMASRPYATGTQSSARRRMRRSTGSRLSTANYSLCATKGGKVICWDVQRDVELATYNPGKNWELWKVSGGF